MTTSSPTSWAASSAPSTASTRVAPRHSRTSITGTAAPARPAFPVVPATVLLAAVSFVGSALTGPVAAIAAVTAMGVVAASVDARTGRIPDRLVVLAGGAVLAGAAASAVADPIGATLGPLGGVAAFGGPLLACHLASPASIGFGDVKLAAVSGAALGLVDARLGLVALCIAAGATAALGLLRRLEALPLGPGLVAGTAIALLGRGAVWP